MNHCLLALGEVKDLNPLNVDLQLGQALVCYELWRQQGDAGLFQSACGHVNDYMENCSEGPLGWLLAGLLSGGKKEYDEAYLNLGKVLQGRQEGTERVGKRFVHSAVKSAMSKGLDEIQGRVRLCGNETVKTFVESAIEGLKKKQQQPAADITTEMCETKARLRELNMRLATGIVKGAVPPKCSIEAMEVACKTNSQPAATFLYLQFRIGLLTRDEDHCRHCIAFLAQIESSKPLLRSQRLTTKGIEHLLWAEYALSVGDRRAAEKHIKLLCWADPAAIQACPDLLRRRTANRDRSLAEARVGCFRHPDQPDSYSRLAWALVQDGKMESLKTAIRLAEGRPSAEMKRVQAIAQEIVKVYDKAVGADYSDDELGTLLKVYTAIRSNTVSPSKDVQTADLINELLAKSSDLLASVRVLFKTCYILHSFGYHNSAVALALTLVESINTVYESMSTRDDCARRKAGGRRGKRDVQRTPARHARFAGRHRLVAASYRAG